VSFRRAGRATVAAAMLATVPALARAQRQPVSVAPAIAPWLIALVGVTSVLSIADYTLALWRARAR